MLLQGAEIPEVGDGVQPATLWTRPPKPSVAGKLGAKIPKKPKGLGDTANDGPLSCEGVPLLAITMDHGVSGQPTPETASNMSEGKVSDPEENSGGKITVHKSLAMVSTVSVRSRSPHRSFVEIPGLPHGVLGGHK